MIKFVVIGCALWIAFFMVIFLLRPSSFLHKITIDSMDNKTKIFTIFVLAILIIMCTKPMGLCPVENGVEHDFRNQYELLTESILNGHLYLDVEVDQKLLQLENPYDMDSRAEAKVQYIWDCAFYNGHYYVYFGVVPVFLVFIPYWLLTGKMLITYQATQIFVSIFICGMFATFYLLAKRFFPKTPYSVYLMMSTAFSLVGIWYSIGHPALYCTAITAGMCLEIWSIFFFVKAVWVDQSEKKSTLSAFIGGLFGALVFGCRPPIAIANLLVLPMLVVYLKNRKLNVKLLLRLLFLTTPYIVVGILLMLYNYARFQNPFEFGSSYQLTLADMGAYASNNTLVDALKVVMEHFFLLPSAINEFPYVSYCGIFINFPIFLLILFLVTRKTIWEKAHKDCLVMFIITSILLVFLIIGIDSYLTPYASERYHMDVYWMMGMVFYILIGYYYAGISDKRKNVISCGISLLALFTCIQCFLLFCVPNNQNLTDYNPEWLIRIRQMIFFWELL